MAIVQERFAFFGEIPRTLRPGEAEQGVVEATNRAMPGLARAVILREIDGEGIMIHETRKGGSADAQSYRRMLEGRGGLERQRWYLPLASWVNPGVRRVAFMRTFRVITAAGAKDAVVAKLANLVELVIGQVPELKLAVIHEGLDRPEEIMLYEEWDGTKAGFLANEAPQPYRRAYREDTAHLIADRGDLEWLSPIRIYESES